MSQMSGALSLDTGKLERATAVSVVAALTAPATDDVPAGPLRELDRKIDQLQRSVAATYDRIRALEDLLKAELERIGRLNRMAAITSEGVRTTTGEIPKIDRDSTAVLGADGEPLYELSPEFRNRIGADPSEAPEFRDPFGEGAPGER